MDLSDCSHFVSFVFYSSELIGPLVSNSPIKFIRLITPFFFLYLSLIVKTYYKKTGLIPWYTLNLFELQAQRVREFKGLCKLVCCLAGQFGIWTSLLGRGVRFGGCS